MKNRHIYTCYICKKEISEYRPVRYVKQLYGYGRYKQYYPIRNFDFCEQCYKTLKKAIEKWKDKKQNTNL